MRHFQGVELAFALEFFNFLALLIKQRSPRGLPGKVTSLTINYDPLRPVSEFADPLLGFAQVPDFTNQRSGLVIEQGNLGVGRLAAITKAEPAADAQRAWGRLVLRQRPAA